MNLFHGCSSMVVGHPSHLSPWTEARFSRFLSQDCSIVWSRWQTDSSWIVSVFLCGKDWRRRIHASHVNSNRGSRCLLKYLYFISTLKFGIGMGPNLDSVSLFALFEPFFRNIEGYISDLMNKLGHTKQVETHAQTQNAIKVISLHEHALVSADFCLSQKPREV